MGKTVKVSCVDGRTFDVDASVFGEWAAHPGIDRGPELRMDWWVVTHVPTGTTICPWTGCLSESEATALARALGERVPSGIVSSSLWGQTDAAPEQAKRIIRSVVFDVRGEVFEP